MATRILLVLGFSMSSDGIRGIVTRNDGLTLVGDVSFVNGDVHELLGKAGPEVVLIDRELPGADGITVAKEIVRTQGASAPLMILLADRHRKGDVMRAAKAGVRGYLIKDQEAWTLDAAIKAVAVGRGWLSPSAAGELLDEYRSHVPQERISQESISLTGRELGVTRLIARGCSNTEIARELGVSESTVKTHVSRILTKLELRSRTQLVAFAYDSGIA